MLARMKKVVLLHRQTTSGNSSVGRARPCQGRGREFESRFPLRIAEIAQLVEHDLAKVGVASSSLVFRSTRSRVKSGFFVNVH